ncbi:serine hydrolase domain-containing protein [Streptomyces sp. NPDC050516]|uniref:serine hydrolase domain-containing protein n=1 Tax=Streptomyces sp. NPDC050516 TaxID=3365621 RepID=UPI0037AF00CD
MPTLRALLVAPLATTLTTALCVLGTTPLPGEEAPSAAHTALARLVADGGAPAAALLAEDASGTRYHTAGTALGHADHFRAGSITKTFVATVVLQLSAEGRLGLDDTVDRYLPGLVRGHGNDGRHLTLRSLLSHTSGLFNYTADTTVPVPLTPDEAVRTALAHSPGPLGTYAYSNTNYVLLGLIIQAVTGRTYAAEAERRIITPLHLTGTSFPGARTTLPEPHSRAYTCRGRDVTELDPRQAGAAGELISTLADLSHFYAALLGGTLLPATQRRELLSTDATLGVYALGIYPQRLSCGLTVWGHNGHISGSYVRAATTPDGRHTAVFRINTDALTDPSLELALLDAEFCPTSTRPPPHAPPTPHAPTASSTPAPPRPPVPARALRPSRTPAAPSASAAAS